MFLKRSWTSCALLFASLILPAIEVYNTWSGNFNPDKWNLR